MLRQSDGRIVLSGQFTHVGDQPRRNLARLNSDGTVDLNFNPGDVITFNANDGVHSLAIQPDGRILAAGYFFNVNGVGPRNLLRFFPNGRFDDSFPTITDSVGTVRVEADGHILVAGAFQNFLGEPRSHIARLRPDGSLSASFAPVVAGNGAIFDLGVQPDGKIIVCGGFTNLAGYARNRIARLHRDGTPDVTFNVPANPHVYAIALQPDDRVVVGGWVGGPAGRLHSLNRVHADGGRDTNFSYSAVGQGIWSVIVQTNGVVVGGEFSSLNGQAVRNFCRIRQDGTLDTNFVQVQGRVNCMEVYPDGRLLLGGDITVGPAGSNRLGLARINLDGTLDQTLPNVGGIRCLAVHPVTGKILLGGDLQDQSGQLRTSVAQINESGDLDESFKFTATDAPRCLAFQSDGSILVGGGFIQIGGQAIRKVARIMTNGVIDSTFNPGPPTSFGVVYSMVLQADGKIIVSGIFNEMGGQLRTNIARLNSDGTLDASFNVTASGFIDGLALQPDGKLLACGDFPSIAGQTRSSLARLVLAEPAFQTLTAERSGRIVWQRDGTAPEVDDVTFELSTDATTYSLLGRPARTANRWELTAPALPIGTNFYVRARGRTRGGYYNGSRGIIESVAQFYFVPVPSLTLVKNGGGPVSLTFSNPGHHYYTVIVASELGPRSVWQTLDVPVEFGAVYRLVDFDSTNVIRRFYRLRWP